MSRTPRSNEAWVVACRPDYVALDDQRLARCLAGAERLVEIHSALANDGLSVLAELFRDGAEFRRWSHYPEHDAVDPQSGAMYYYHAHDQNERPDDEHGHFHTFVADPSGTGFNHLVAVSMDARGMVRSLFTTNRWVTDEHIRSAAEVGTRLETFTVARARPSWLVAQWLQALLGLLEPQVRRLLVARDEVLGLDRNPVMPQDAAVLEDRSLHVVGEEAVSLFAAIEAVEAVAIERGLV
ncbi:MAG: DUF6969 family protein [Halothiobacillaceae bacterium]